MNRDMFKGRWLQLKGRIRQAFGGATGNRSEQVKGGVQEVGGRFQEGVGNVEDDLSRPKRPVE